MRAAVRVALEVVREAPRAVAPVLAAVREVLAVGQEREVAGVEQELAAGVPRWPRRMEAITRIPTISREYCYHRFPHPLRRTSR